MPTTLLSQVDSSVGGKTAINHPLGKNMIGAFYQPRAVIIDMTVLKTLPPREVSAGLAEIIKYGCILDADFFNWLETNMQALVAGDADALAYAIQKSCQIKAQVVAADERESSGQRALLNFGTRLVMPSRLAWATVLGFMARQSAAAWPWQRCCLVSWANSMCRRSNGWWLSSIEPVCLFSPRLASPGLSRLDGPR